VRPIAEKLIDDSKMRQKLFPLGDDDLAITLNGIDQTSGSEPFSWRWTRHFGSAKVEKYVNDNLPKPK
jgi:hypothetical protein